MAPSIDLVARLGTPVVYADLEVEEMDVEGVPVRLATPRALHRLERDTARAIDAEDAARLRNAFDLDEDD